MKPEHDFSKGEHNRFYRPEATHDIPVYLEPDIRAELDRLAHERGINLEELVNRWLRMNIEVAGTSRNGA